MPAICWETFVCTSIVNIFRADVAVLFKKYLTEILYCVIPAVNVLIDVCEDLFVCYVTEYVTNKFEKNKNMEQE